jgi:hypothetical protein
VCSVETGDDTERGRTDCDVVDTATVVNKRSDRGSRSGCGVESDAAVGNGEAVTEEANKVNTAIAKRRETATAILHTCVMGLNMLSTANK